MRMTRALLQARRYRVITRARSDAACSGVFGDQKYRSELQPAVGTPAAASPAATFLSNSAHPPSPVSRTAMTSRVDGEVAGTSINERSDVSGIAVRIGSGGRGAVAMDRYASSRPLVQSVVVGERL